MDNLAEKLVFKVLGSGCCVPKTERCSPGYFIKYKDESFLLDCGSGTLRQLSRAKEDYKTLTGVILSHFHPDHSADFMPLIQALSYTPDFEREDHLLVIGPPGLEKFVKSLFEIYGFGPKGFEIEFIELDSDKNQNSFTLYRLDKNQNKYELTIEAIKGNHTENSIVTKVKYKSNGKYKGLVYSGDTDFDPIIGGFASKIELLVLECSFPYKIDKHLTPEEAGKIAEIAQPGRLLLTHFYPPCDNPDIKVQHRVKEYYIGQVLVAQDFTEVII